MKLLISRILSRISGINTFDNGYFPVETNHSITGRTQEIPPARLADFKFKRPKAKGKFLYVGEQKIWVRGVTYGTFRPCEERNEYHNPEVVERDFAQIAASGLNAIRTYTVPPRWLLDIAQRYGLRVMVGIPWEQHITFLDSKKQVQSIEDCVQNGVRACSGHPAILCYAIGNEIPASIVRWHGHRRVERYLQRLYRVAKAEDPEALITYVNYPTTEYLQLPFMDVVCFNVYLESQKSFEAYLARLHNIAEDRPLIIAEIGLDSHRHGEDVQAEVLDRQIRTAFAAGCAGAFVFSWTDEWHRGGYDIMDWNFGLTRGDRHAKPALAAVRDAFAEVPFPKDLSWPRISVVICSYNGARTIRDCFEGLQKLKYPNFEVIVVNDGSTDATAAIAQEYGFRLISTENRGLGNARNTGLEAATGQIVAYIDDDAYPEPHWLTYLAATFMSTSHAGVGGPNIPPPGDGSIADCVANAPGGPVHVLLSDQEAEHIPGCNMAFRKACLQAIGGFDPQFHAAGDDVDVCWRLQQQRWTLGFNPAAMVWHHRRNSVRAYWKQQMGYGKAEALLENKWPEKYNGAGHLAWNGRVYGKGLTYTLGWVKRIYHGTWCSAPFQSLYQPAQSLLESLPMMPEWYFVIIALATLSILGALWTPLLVALPLLALAVFAPIIKAVVNATHASFTSSPRSHFGRLRMYTLTAFLHLIQPLARLWGRLSNGLTPWRRRGVRGLSFPWPRIFTIWSERGQDPHKWLEFIEKGLKDDRAVILRGGDFDRWDLEARDGRLGAIRIQMAIEEHGGGRQLVRFRLWPRCSPGWLILIIVFTSLSAWAALDRAWPASIILGLMALIPAVRTSHKCSAATSAVHRALKRLETGEG